MEGRQGLDSSRQKCAHHVTTWNNFWEHVKHPTSAASDIKGSKYSIPPHGISVAGSTGNTNCTSQTQNDVNQSMDPHFLCSSSSLLSSSPSTYSTISKKTKLPLSLSKLTISTNQNMSSLVTCHLSFYKPLRWESGNPSTTNPHKYPFSVIAPKSWQVLRPHELH